MLRNHASQSKSSFFKIERSLSEIIMNETPKSENQSVSDSLNDVDWLKKFDHSVF